MKLCYYCLICLIVACCYIKKVSQWKNNNKYNDNKTNKYFHRNATAAAKVSYGRG